MSRSAISKSDIEQFIGEQEGGETLDFYTIAEHEFSKLKITGVSITTGHDQHIRLEVAFLAKDLTPIYRVGAHYTVSRMMKDDLWTQFHSSLTTDRSHAYAKYLNMSNNLDEGQFKSDVELEEYVVKGIREAEERALQYHKEDLAD